MTPTTQGIISTNSAPQEMSSADCLNQLVNSARYLDWTQRPPVLQREISNLFENIARDTNSAWGLFNGNDKYTIGQIDEHELMKKIIETAPNDQKEFYALDIGAGKFQWLSAMADYLNQQPNLPKDIKIHIIGIRGETNTEPAIIEKGLCTIYRLGAFKIEEIAKQFENLGLSLNAKIDLAISHFVFRHLLDPVGTFAQVYNLLRPSTGFLLTDGFAHHSEDSDEETTNVFLDTSAPFLRIPYSGYRSADHFILRRPNDTPCQLPMRYTEIVGKVLGHNTGGTKYERTSPPHELLECHRGFEAACGGKEMYEFLKANRWGSDCLTWQAIQTKDNIDPPLHTAILANDHEAVVQLLDSGSKINELGPYGYTPLDLCFEEHNLELFTLLLSRGADANLCRRNRRETIWHDVAAHDTEGQFLQALFNAGVNINPSQMQSGDSPLDSAIWKKNVKAVEILIKNGADSIHEISHEILLEAPAFEPLRASGLIADFLRA